MKSLRNRIERLEKSRNDTAERIIVIRVRRGHEREDEAKVLAQNNIIPTHKDMVICILGFSEYIVPKLVRVN